MKFQFCFMWDFFREINNEVSVVGKKFFEELRATVNDYICW